MPRCWSVAPTEISRTVVVFDLDDTLYFESDYRISGIRAVKDYLSRLYGESLFKQFAGAELEAPHTDFIEALVGALNCPPSTKQSLLWIYRLHSPSIRLRDGMQELIDLIEPVCAKIAILTDGRAVSQRQKILSLGLQRFPAYVSEEYESEKPEFLRYRRIMEDHPADRYVYIADNPKKDFLAPNSLGWQTLGLRGLENNVHAQTCDGLDIKYHPQDWVEQPSEIFKLLR